MAIKIKMIENSNKEKKPIRLFTDPRYRGADVDYNYVGSLPTVEIPIDKIVYWEKDKIESDSFNKEVGRMIFHMKQGLKLPPIVVTETGFFTKKYLVIDGHHRAIAFKHMNIKNIPAKIVPKDKVKKQGGIPTLDESQLEFIKNLPNIGE